MGLVIAAGGLGGFFFPFLVTGLISSMGWQMTWLALAAIQLICAVLIGGLILVRNRPEDMGQVPDGVSTTQTNEIQEKTSHASRVYQGAVDWQVWQVVRKPTTWLIAVLCAANFLAIGTVTAHQVAYLKDIGFSSMTAATTLSLVPGMSIFGRLGFGLLGTKFQVRHLAIASFVGQLVALVILLTTRSLFLIYIYAALFGISYGALVVALPTFIGVYYERAHYVQTLGLIFPLAIVAEAIGPLMAGAIYDTMGTYMPAFAIVTGFSGVGLICTILARPPELSQRA